MFPINAQPPVMAFMPFFDVRASSDNSYSGFHVTFPP